MKKFKTQNLIIIGYVLFLIILLLPLLSYTQDITENPNRPLSKNEVRKVNFQEVMRFSDVPEKEIYFKRPRRIKLDDNGNIYIQDNPHILKFGPDGKFLAKLIKEGQGPGELVDGISGNLSDFTLVGNKVIAFSAYPQKIMWFNEKGEFKEEKRFPIRQRPQFVVTPDLNYYVFESKLPRPDEMRNVGPFKYSTLLCRISPDFKEKELIHTFPLEGMIYEEGHGSYRTVKYVVIDSEILIVNTSEDYEFISLSLKDGKKLKTFTHKYKREKHPWRDGYRPAIQAIHYVCPELWVITYTRDKDGFPLICSHDLETGKVEEFCLRFPTKSDSAARYNSNNMIIVKGFIFAIEQNSEGFYNIVKYRME